MNASGTIKSKFFELVRKKQTLSALVTTTGNTDAPLAVATAAVNWDVTSGYCFTCVIVTLTMAVQGRVLVYGGKGALGSTCVSYFKSKNYWVGSIDRMDNEEANFNVKVTGSTLFEQKDEIAKSLATCLGESKLDAIFCVAGGWAGGNAGSKDFLKSADDMWKQSVWSSVIASSLAATHLKEGGVLTLPGAAPATDGTPGMIGYGMAKAAVHQLTKSLAGDKSGLPAKAVAFATLPITLDTPNNRKWMAKADQTTWTPMEFVSELFYKWCVDQERPANGSLVKMVTKAGKTDLVLC
ncbi:dihydropteridine reductase-like [Argonauta hians]